MGYNHRLLNTGRQIKDAIEKHEHKHGITIHPLATSKLRPGNHPNYLRGMKHSPPISIKYSKLASCFAYKVSISAVYEILRKDPMSKRKARAHTLNIPLILMVSSIVSDCKARKDFLRKILSFLGGNTVSSVKKNQNT